MTLTLDPTNIDVAALRRLWQGEACKLDDASIDRIRASAASVERIVDALHSRGYTGHRLAERGPPVPLSRTEITEHSRSHYIDVLFLAGH